MLRKERVWHTLNELCHRQISDAELANGARVGVTTLELATILTLDRANTSRDLNQLVEEGRVIKLVGKPVLYLDRSFLEEYLGEPLHLAHSRLHNLTVLYQQRQHLMAQPIIETHRHTLEEPQHLTPIHRAVRWLDLPEDP